MRLHKLIRRRIREQRDGVSFASDVNVAVSGNVGERGAVTHVSSRQQSTADDGDKKSRRTDD
jgi:hypothetical protein